MPSIQFIYAWKYRLKIMREAVTSVTFWMLFFGILAALVVWFVLLYLAIKYADTSLAMASTFCSSEDQRDRHLLAITLLTPLFIVGLIGVIGEWMSVMDNRRLGRKSNYKPLAAFSVLMQLAALFILIALQC
jgi:hypothetical protein